MKKQKTKKKIHKAGIFEKKKNEKLKKSSKNNATFSNYKQTQKEQNY